MKVKVTDEINVFELFVHDNEALGAIDPHSMAEAINEHMLDSGWRVRPPDGLDRFTLQAADHEEYFTERCYSAEQVKSYLPFEAVEALEEINDMEFDLSARPPA